MNKIRFYLTLCIFLIPTPSFAILGVGDIVSDPGSYIYYIEQIAAMEAQVDTALKKLEEAKVQTKGIMAMKNQLEGAYNRVAGLKDRMVKRSERLGSISEGKIASAEYDLNYLQTNQGTLSDGSDLSEWKKTELVIDQEWNGAGDNPTASHQKRERVRQKIIKRSLVQSTTLLGGIGERLKEIEKLNAEMEGKKGTAELQAFTNRLLLELIYGQQDMIALLATMAQAQAAIEYKGEQDKAAYEARLKEMEAAKKIKHARGGLIDTALKSGATYKKHLNY